jgi:hypothetical protein
MRVLCVAVVLILMTACAPRSTTQPDTATQRGIVVPSNLNADEAKVIATARQFLSTNQNWLDAKFERPRRSPDGGWSVLVWKLPVTPELDMTIEIDDAGNVTRSNIGL